MKKLLLAGGVLLLTSTTQEASAQLALENFNSGTLPAGWVLINDGHTVSTSFTGVAAIQTGLNSAAWMPYQVVGTGDYSMITTSKFNPTAQADRWLITPAFSVTSPNTVLKWMDYDLNSGEALQVLVSPTAGTTASSFTATLSNAPAGTGGLTTHAINIGTYNGSTIRVAFRDNVTNNWGLILDNVSTAVLPATDAALTSFTPSASSPVSYGTSGSNVTLAGTVTNNGASNLTSFVVKYQQGSSAVVSQSVTGVNIPPLGKSNFTFTTQFNIPGTSTYPIKAWVEATGDQVHTNDSATTTITGVTFMPKKKLLIEEATGTWCGWCVRGIVYMDSIWKTNANDVSLVAVHNNDPMTLSAYDTWIGTKITGYPSIVVDRREVADPSDIFGSAGANIFNNEKNYFGFADISLGNASYSGNNFTLPVTVKPALNLSGDYRLLLILTEDGAHGTTSHTDPGGTSVAWDMHNYYSSASQNLPLSGGGVNYQTSPVYIPASQMFYNFVGRALIPSINGAQNSLPATMTAGTTYSYTFNGTIDPSWNKSKMRGVVALIRNSDGQVLNSNNTRWTLGVDNVAAGINKFSVYPNPANETATLHFELSGATSVGVEVVDMMGKVVSTIPATQMGAGEHTLPVSVSSLASGLYNVKVTTASGTVVERLSVVK